MPLFSYLGSAMTDDRRAALAQDERALRTARAILQEFEMPDPIDALEAILIELDQEDELPDRVPAERIYSREGNVVEVDFGPEDVV